MPRRKGGGIGTKAQYVVVMTNEKRKGLRKEEKPVRQYRRKQGVNTGNFGCLHAIFL